MPSRLSINVRSRRATDSVMSFSSDPRGPWRAELVAAMSRIEHHGADGACR